MSGEKKPDPVDYGSFVHKSIEEKLGDPAEIGVRPDLRRNFDDFDFSLPNSLLNAPRLPNRPGHAALPDPYLEDRGPVVLQPPLGQDPSTSRFHQSDDVQKFRGMRGFAADGEQPGVSNIAVPAVNDEEKHNRPRRQSKRRPKRREAEQAPEIEGGANRDVSQEGLALADDRQETPEDLHKPPPTDPADWADDAPFDPADAIGPKAQSGRALTASRSLDPHAHEMHQWWDPHRDYYAHAIGGPPRTDLDWGAVAGHAVGTAIVGIGTVFAVGALVAAGVVSAPFVLVAGIGLLAIGGTRSFFGRANTAFDADLENFGWDAGLAAAGDTVGITPIIEGSTGYDAVTGRQLYSYERSKRLGTGIGLVTTIATGPKVFGAGQRFGQGAVQRGFVDPYTVPSISRPSMKNPLAIGKYTTPEGVILRGIRPVNAGKRALSQYRRSRQNNHSRRQSLSNAYGAGKRAGEGSYRHIRRHWSDQPGRVGRSGDPTIHSVFNKNLGSRYVRLVDDAFRQGTSPTGLMVDQGGRVVLVAITDSAVGRALGNKPYYFAKDGHWNNYGAALDTYSLVLDVATLEAVSMYPGFPGALGPMF